LLEVGDAGAHDTLKASEVLEQLAPLRGPQTRHDLQDRLVVAPGAFAPVPRDREPVSLVPDTLNQA
jgi:hypothetical protein